MTEDILDISKNVIKPSPLDNTAFWWTLKKSVPDSEKSVQALTVVNLLSIIKPKESEENT